MSTHHHRFTTLARAAGALVVLAVLMVGVPLALIRIVGCPLPTVVPTIDQLQSATRDGIADAVWIKAFAVVVWLSWAQLVIALVSEIIAVARGRAARPRAGLAWAQSLTGRLIGAVVLAAGMIGSAPPAGAGPLPTELTWAREVPVVTPVVAPAPAAALLPPAHPPVAPTSVSSSHTVVRGESLSSIADHELGLQAEWPTLWRLNQGRTFGDRVFDDPNLILPGWQLGLPDHAPAPVAFADPVEPVLIPPIVVRAPEPPPGPTIAQPPALPLTATEALPTAALAESPPIVGQPDQTPVDPVATATTVAATAPLTTTPAVTPFSSSADSQVDAPASIRFAALLGATLLATGVAGSLLSSRRQALRSSTASSVVMPPDPDVGAVDAAAAAGSDALAMARLELGLRALAGALGRDGSDARPLAVKVDDGRLEVMLDRPVTLGAPWEGDDSGRRWILPRRVPLTALTDEARAVAAPCPALVGLGRVGGAEVFVDLESVAVLDLGVAGDAALRAVVATLAVTPLADGLRVIVVGQDVPELRGRHEVLVVPDVRTAVAEVEAASAPLAAATNGTRSTFRLRAVAGYESWEPVVVVLPSGTTDGLERLVELARGHRGVAVVGTGLDEAAWRIAADADGGARLEPLGWPIEPHGLGTDELQDVGAALASSGGLLAELEEPVAVAAATAPVAASVDRPWSLMVRVLGQVDVVDRSGAAVAFERAKALELVVWLAQHPGSSTRSGARSALWAADVSNASFSNVVSEARRTLARAVDPPEDQDWLARTYAERLPLNPSVVLDADVAAEHLARARSLPPEAAVVELQQALALVRGVPYAGTSYLWPDAEALPSTLTLLATSIASELARRLLELGDVEGVFAATAVGLEVLPGHEELVGLRMRAHAARGDRSALRLELASYEQAVLTDPWAGEASPALVALCRELLGGAVPIAGS